MIIQPIDKDLLQSMKEKDNDDSLLVEFILEHSEEAGAVVEDSSEIISEISELESESESNASLDSITGNTNFDGLGFNCNFINLSILYTNYFYIIFILV